MTALLVICIPIVITVILLAIALLLLNKYSTLKSCTKRPFDLRNGYTFEDLGCYKHGTCKKWMTRKRLDCWDCDDRKLVRPCGGLYV